MSRKEENKKEEEAKEGRRLLPIGLMYGDALFEEDGTDDLNRTRGRFEYFFRMKIQVMAS